MKESLTIDEFINWVKCGKKMSIQDCVDAGNKLHAVGRGIRTIKSKDDLICVCIDSTKESNGDGLELRFSGTKLKTKVVSDDGVEKFVLRSMRNEKFFVRQGKKYA